MNKATIVATMAAGLILLGSGVVYATGQIARSNSISESDAANFAYVDAGISPEDATVTKMEFDYEHGVFVYEIEFRANGTEYDYVIDSNNGRVLGKEYEVYDASVTKPEVAVNPSPVHKPNVTTNNNKNNETEDVVVSVEEAKQIALDQAGVDASAAVFEKAKLEYENGRQIYDIEFYVRGELEYDCEIDATTGKILEESREAWELEDELEAQALENKQAATNTPAQSSTPSESESATQSGTTAAGESAAQSGSTVASESTAQSSTPATSTPAAQPSSPAASAPAASTPASKPSTPAAQPSAPESKPSTPAAQPSAPASKPSTPAAQPSAPASTPSTPAASSNTVTSGDDTYKQEGGVVYEYDDDDGTWEREEDKKIENGVVYDYDDDTGTWEPDDDDRDYDDDWDDEDDD